MVTMGTSVTRLLAQVDDRNLEVYIGSLVFGD